MKKKSSTVILIIIFLIGVSLLLYPTVSNYWNSFHQSKAIASYMDDVSVLDNEEYEKVLSDAVKYNESFRREALWVLSDEEKEEYNRQLNITGNGIMGYIEIPSIDCSLPIYHGTDDSILQVATGHLEGSSLPVGGESTHCVISGHRGLPSAKLFTNIDRLVEGDLFMLCVLNEVFTYEVDQIRIVKPENISDLCITEGEDLCTLVTCTPYGVNSHRMLVRGHRVENVYKTDVRVTADALPIDETFVTLAVAAPILVTLFICLLIRYRKR